jgi:LCP family protein required for cell wall assembly
MMCATSRVIRASIVVMPPRHSPVIAAILSGLIPGTGQWFAGRRWRAAAQLVPIAGLALAAVYASTAMSRAELIGDVLQPAILVGLFALNAVIATYRLMSVADAFQLAERRWPVRRRRPARAGRLVTMTVLVAAVLAPHVAVGYVTAGTYALVTSVFAPDGSADLGGAYLLPDDGATPPPGPTEDPEDAITPSAPADLPWVLAGTPWPSSSPEPTLPEPSPMADQNGPAWAADGRLDILFVGSDAGPDRWSLRTDAMILLSVDIATGRAAMFGIPRNLRNVPLPPESAAAFPCRCFPGLLNALYVQAAGHPDRFPGGPLRGFRAVRGAVDMLTGVKLDGMVVVDLGGFVRLVDVLGGLDIMVPEALHDNRYPLEDGSGWIVLDIPAGHQHLDGRMALAYARSRHQDSDYGRMARQQRVFLAFRRQLDPCSIVPRLPALLEVARHSIWTDFPIAELPGLLGLAARVDDRHVYQLSFTPHAYSSYLDATEVLRIRYVVAHAFKGGSSSTTDLGADPTVNPCG